MRVSVPILIGQAPATMPNPYSIGSAAPARLSKLKKNELASEAERLEVDARWLPVMLQAAVVEVQEGSPSDADTTE